MNVTGGYAAMVPAIITPDQVNAARASLVTALDRFIAVAAGTRPGAPATAHWSVADTVAHLVIIAAIDVSLVRAADPMLPGPGLKALLRATTFDTIAAMNAELLGHFAERDVAVLARRLRDDVDELLRATAALPPATEVEWLGGSRLSVAGLLAHLTNELLIHGRDIARITRTPWPIPPEDAAQFFDLFLVGVTRSGYGALLDHDTPDRPGRIAVEFRSTYTTPVCLVLDDGVVTVQEPGVPTDVRVSFHPPTLNLMLFGRISRLRAALSGKLVLGGRRPWLLQRFMRKMRPPS